MNEQFDDEKFGAGLSTLEKLKLLSDWGPLLLRLQQVMSAPDAHARAVAFLDTCLWAAGKSATHMDDEALEHLEAILKSPEGTAFFDWIVAQVEGPKK